MYVFNILCVVLCTKDDWFLIDLRKWGIREETQMYKQTNSRVYCTKEYIFQLILSVNTLKICNSACFDAVLIDFYTFFIEN